MRAVVTTGIGGVERLAWREVPRPEPGPGELLLRVLAAGVNTTDINTRVGWYDPDSAAGGDARGWQGATPFPLIQGADCCGEVFAAGPGADAGRVGERVIVRACMRVQGFGRMETRWLGTDMAGAFAEFVAVPEGECFGVRCDWTDAELASLPCAYGTAETMVGRAGVGAGARVLVTGASGGVGSATVQLLARRGVEVVASAGRDKSGAVAALGAARVIGRGEEADLAPETFDAVIDNVGGDGFGARLRLLARGGRYVTSGAIAGPVVALDLRELYLRDRRLIGSTAWDEAVFPDLVGYVERGEIRPLVAATWPLREIAQAQAAFLEKRHVGKIVLIP